MHLPTARREAGDRQLPWTAATAAGLLDALLAEDETRTARLTSLLANDPGFAWWGAMQFEPRAELPAGIGALADWLSPRLLRLLANPATPPRWGEPSEMVAEWDSPPAWLRKLAAVKLPESDPDEPITKRLPELVRRLARCQELETEFQTALEREKLSALKELAYGASHEINNPLANISMRAQALLRDETDLDRRRKLTMINAQAFRAHEMISDLMLFAKPPPLQPTSFDLWESLDEVFAELEPLAAEQGTELLCIGNEEPCLLNADRQQVEVVVKAFCQNALEAIGEGGQITVSVCRSETAPEWVGLSVRDTGPGIPASVRPHLFDPFYSGREAGRGLGLGLSKCWRIAEQHGGRIEVRSPESGAELVFWLPRRE